MKNIGTRLLNQYVAKYFLDYLRKVNYQKTDTPINNFAWSYFHFSEIPWKTDAHTLSELPEDAAIYLRKRILGNEPRQSMRLIVRDHPHLGPLLGHGAQSWLILTYLQTLHKIYELDQGILQYGIDKDLYRTIEENVIAARLMFAEGMGRLAEKIAEIYKDTPNLALAEGGAGNGAAMFSVLEKFHSFGLFPHFLLSDIDQKTKSVAEEYFRSRGFKSKHFPWAKIDIGDPKDLAAIASHFSQNNLAFNINFIVHEWEPIAEKFFAATSQSMPNADLVVSEFFLPEGYPNCAPDPDFPWWFVALHHLSGQHLRTEKDFMAFPKLHGYKLFDRIDYQVHYGKPVTSTLFLRKK